MNLLRISGLWLISGIRSDPWKVIQSVNLAWSIWIQSLKPASYHPLLQNDKGWKKHTHSWSSPSKEEIRMKSTSKSKRYFNKTEKFYINTTAPIKNYWIDSDWIKCIKFMKIFNIYNVLFTHFILYQYVKWLNGLYFINHVLF